MRAASPLVVGYIDSASLAGTLMALLEPDPSRWSEWTATSAVVVTSLLVHHDGLGIAPAPTRQSRRGLSPGDLQLLIATELGASNVRPIRTAAKRSLDLAAADVAEYVASPRAREAWELTRKDPSCDDWRERARRHFWVSHSTMLNGLFNAAYIPLLAQIMDCPERDLKRSWEKSCDLSVVASWSKHPPITDESFDLADDAFLLAAMLRGRFHDKVAQLEGSQIVHHPLRHLVLAPLEVTSETVLTPVERYLSILPLASALLYENMEERIHIWAANTTRLREVAVGLPQDDVAEESALDEAWLIAHGSGFEHPPAKRMKMLQTAGELGLKGGMYLAVRYVDFLALDVAYVLLSGSIPKSIGARAGRVLGPRSTRIPAHLEKGVRAIDRRTPGRIVGRFTSGGPPGSPVA